jgi:peroxiredoxin
MKLIYCFLIFLWPFMSTAQTVKPLQIGDNIPDIIISDVYNYTASTIHSSDLKGKLLILDFMATTCVPCIQVLPRFDSLHKQYQKQLKIILVSPEKPQRIQAFLKTHSSLNLPLAADSNSAKFFPHTYISHVVWINPAGIVCAITHPEYVNSKNIQTILNGQKVNWPVKRDIPGYDFKQPILVLNVNNIPKQVLPKTYYYTSVINYMPGVPKQNKVITDTATHLVHTTLINYEILDLYRILFNRYRLPLTHMKVEIKNRDRLFYNMKEGYYETWKSKNMYCLEASMPSYIPLEQQRQKLINEMDFYYGFHTYLKTQIVNCLVLRNSTDIFRSKKNAGKNGLSPASIAGILNNNLDEMPVIDETKGMLQFKLPITEEQVNDSVFLHKILNEYGLELTVEQRPIELMVITDSENEYKSNY